MPPCSHPFASLEVDAGRTGQRGQASTFAVICNLCEVRFPGALGVGVLVTSGVADSEQLWAAVKGVGGRRAVTPKSEPVPADPGRCAHHLGWLRVDAGRAGQRGYTGSVWIWCAGCRVKWDQASGLAVFLAELVRERKKIAQAIRKLGGNPAGEILGDSP